MKTKNEILKKEITITFHYSFDSHAAFENFLNEMRENHEDMYDDLSISLMGTVANKIENIDGINAKRVIRTHERQD